ncbi:hypothetical protein QBC32DRAFT_317907 [Pseudoneurospora amorphoporcata]|uniref:SAP domain-containing protein n=1 Tax=Pseudoneurospora amorphoporcata TaxID=241081 RepID=A0AAN6NR84_9PEZI|nr:hypothetical protein QBC32DRAFT_317907 [Pseudoneurospora amorphoporcata]
MRSLQGWLPNDAHWKHGDYTRNELQEQRRARKIPTTGYKFELVERLEAYANNDRSEKRRSNVLRYVLSCPEPFRWQGAFLSSKLEIMYRNSRAVNTLLCAHRKDRNLFPICALCFKTSVRDGSGTCCLTCGSAMHNSCVYAAQRARKLERQDECWRCEDGAEWSLDKYSSKEKARRAGPAAPIVTPAAINLTGKTVQQSLEHPARYEDKRSSSSGQIADDEKPNNQLATSLPPKPPTLPLRPTSPTRATALILPAPQGTEDAHLEPGEIHETTDTTAHFPPPIPPFLPPTAPPFPPPPPPPIPPPVSTMDWSNEESKSASCSSKDMNAPSHFTNELDFPHRPF